MSQGKVIYTPFISKSSDPLQFEISEPTAIQPISIPFSKDKSEEVISGEPLKIKYDLTQYNPQKQSNSGKAYEPQYPVGEKEDYNTVETSDKPIEWKFELGVLKPKIGNTYSDRKEFVRDLTGAYEKELEARGLSKEYAKYIVAQDALESTWGKSSLARYYNFGGIKEFREGQEGIEADTKESFDGKTLKTVKQRFRKFKDLEDYVKYKIDLLGNSNFNVFAYRPEQLYNRLVTAPKKYATDPDYENKMNKMYKSVLALFS